MSMALFGGAASGARREANRRLPAKMYCTASASYTVELTFVPAAQLYSQKSEQLLVVDHVFGCAGQDFDLFCANPAVKLSSAPVCC